MKIKNKMFLKLSIYIPIFVFLLIMLLNFVVSSSTKNKLYTDVNNIPKNKVGLVLGTIKYLENNRINLYYLYRIDAAEKLFKYGKVDYLIVSGDNSRYGYNEPKDMKEDLVKRGIPSQFIYEDFAGLRTFDSIVRAKEIFDQSSITIISQKFHNERALFISKKYNIDAIGFNAKDVRKVKAIKVILREYLARVKLFLDLYVLNTKPKFLGDKIKII